MPTFRDDIHRGTKVPLVKTDDIDDLAITTGKLADGAVTTQKIAIGAIKRDLLDNGSVTSEKIADGAVEWRHCHGIVRVWEDGFYLVDNNLNVGLRLTDNSFDTLGLGKDYRNIIETANDGFYIVDSRLNIGLYFRNLNDNNLMGLDESSLLGKLKKQNPQPEEQSYLFYSNGLFKWVKGTAAMNTLLSNINKQNPALVEDSYLHYSNGIFNWQKVTEDGGTSSLTYVVVDGGSGEPKKDIDFIVLGTI